MQKKREERVSSCKQRRPIRVNTRPAPLCFALHRNQLACSARVHTVAARNGSFFRPLHIAEDSQMQQLLANPTISALQDIFAKTVLELCFVKTKEFARIIHSRTDVPDFTTVTIVIQNAFV